LLRVAVIEFDNSKPFGSVYCIGRDVDETCVVGDKVVYNGGRIDSVPPPPAFAFTIDENGIEVTSGVGSEGHHALLLAVYLGYDCVDRFASEPLPTLIIHSKVLDHDDGVDNFGRAAVPVGSCRDESLIVGEYLVDGRCIEAKIPPPTTGLHSSIRNHDRGKAKPGGGVILIKRFSVSRFPSRVASTPKYHHQALPYEPELVTMMTVKVGMLGLSTRICVSRVLLLLM